MHIDYAGPLKGYYSLVIVDSCSKWPRIYKQKHSTVASTIKALDEVFSIPDTLVSDNGTMFTGREFREYCKSLAIEHVTTLTYNPRSNGQAERFIDKFKKALQKNQEFDIDKKSIQTFLTIYRIT